MEVSTMTLTDQALVGVLIALVSGTFGKWLGGRKKVDNDICIERRGNCFDMVVEKIGELTRLVDRLEKAVNSKLLGL